ncbi:MAG: hypothetical protein DRI98_14150 [Bacteroidetes bacterium]|nr:MAG: hypothetical protein DRI98_14150 [Bacteroidota bacterium]
MLERYREDYPGEFVITQVTWKDGKKHQEREWIDNPITNVHANNKATCIAESYAVQTNFYAKVARNNGGLLGRERMQVYGVESVWDKMVPDFLVCQNSQTIPEMIKAGYPSKSVVYSTAKNCLKFPGELFLIPYSLSMQSHAAACWLACFDGHKEIYLVGYEKTDKKGAEQTKMIHAVAQVMKVYPHVKFIQVTTNASPDAWRRRVNFSNTRTEDYVSNCDV